MDPLILFLALVAWLASKHFAQRQSPPPPAPDPHLRLVEIAMSEMADIARLAITGPELAPYAPPTGQTPADLPTPESMAWDDAADPLEVFLGPDFMRTDGAMWNEDEDNSFGIPGLSDAS